MARANPHYGVFGSLAAAKKKARELARRRGRTVNVLKRRADGKLNKQPVATIKPNPLHVMVKRTYHVGVFGPYDTLAEAKKKAHQMARAGHVGKVMRRRADGTLDTKPLYTARPKAKRNPTYFLYRNQNGAGEHIEAASKGEAIKKARAILGGMLHDKSGWLALHGKRIATFKHSNSNPVRGLSPYAITFAVGKNRHIWHRYAPDEPTARRDARRLLKKEFGSAAHLIAVRHLQADEERRLRNPTAFEKCVASVKKKGSAVLPKSVCATVGRKKFGKQKFQALAAAGKALKHRHGNPHYLDVSKELGSSIDKHEIVQGPWQRVMSGTPVEILKQGSGKRSQILIKADYVGRILYGWVPKNQLTTKDRWHESR